MIKASAVHPDVRLRLTHDALADDLRLSTKTKFMENMGLEVARDLVRLEGTVLGAVRVKYGRASAQSNNGKWNAAGEFFTPCTANGWSAASFGCRPNDERVFLCLLEGPLQRRARQVEPRRARARHAGRQAGGQVRALPHHRGADLVRGPVPGQRLRPAARVHPEQDRREEGCVLGADGDRPREADGGAGGRGDAVHRPAHRAEERPADHGQHRGQVEHEDGRAQLRHGEGHVREAVAQRRRALRVLRCPPRVQADVAKPPPLTAYLRRLGVQDDEPAVVGIAATTGRAKEFISVDFDLQSGRQEEVVSLEALMGTMLARYKAAHDGKNPHRVVIYRDGVSEGEHAMVLTKEAVRLEKAIKDVCGGERPITMVVCTKRHDARFFLTQIDSRARVPSSDRGRAPRRRTRPRARSSTRWSRAATPPSSSSPRTPPSRAPPRPSSTTCCATTTT